MNKNSFVFYSSLYEALQNVENMEERAGIYDAICEYALYGVEPENLTPMGKIIFAMATPNIKAAADRYENAVANGKKGGRPKEVDTNKVIELRRQGLTNKEISIKLGCSEKSVERINSKYDLTRQNRQNLNVNVNDNDNVNVNDNENINDNGNGNGNSEQTTDSFGKEMDELLGGNYE